MDVNWFKTKQKLAGVTTADIAARLGRDRSIVSHIYNGRQKMSLEWARAFSEALNVSVNEVLERAGVLDRDEAASMTSGFSDGDAALWVGKPGEMAQVTRTAQTLGGGRAGIDVWEVRTDALILSGYLPGDLLLVDTHQSDRCKAGDAVIAQVYNTTQGVATTILRRFQPPILVSATTNPDDQKAYVVDGDNVLVRGRIIASWRRTL